MVVLIEPTDEFVKIFGASVSFDKVLALYDIEGSIAHATMLSEVEVLTDLELKEILNGLDKSRMRLLQVNLIGLSTLKMST